MVDDRERRVVGTGVGVRPRQGVVEGDAGVTRGTGGTVIGARVGVGGDQVAARAARNTAHHVQFRPGTK